MKTIRNLAFLLLCLVAFGAQRVTVGAFDCPFVWCQGDLPTEANGCDVEALFYPDPEEGCPVVEYTGSCPWEVGCLDAHVAAEEICGWWEDNSGYGGGNGYLVTGFYCDDPLDPPTDFTFRCEPWAWCVG